MNELMRVSLPHDFDCSVHEAIPLLLAVTALSVKDEDFVGKEDSCDSEFISFRNVKSQIRKLFQPQRLTSLASHLVWLVHIY